MLTELIEFSGVNLSTFFSLDIVSSNKAAAQSANLIDHLTESTSQPNQPFNLINQST